MLVEQRRARHEEPGRAEPALHRASLNERLLDRGQRAVGGETFDRDHGRPVGSGRR